MSLAPCATDVSWLLTSFTDGVPGVEQTVAVSPDGLLMAFAGAADRPAAERLGAVVSGLRSLAEGGGQAMHKGATRQIIVDMDLGYLFVSSVPGGSILGVLTTAGCDLAALGYEMTLLAQRCAPALTPEVVAELQMGLSS